MSTLMRCSCAINPFIHFVYGNQNQMAQAVTVVRNGTLGRIYKSAPTVFISYMAQAVTFVQWQYFFNSPTCPPETRCVCTNKVLHHPIYGNQNQVVQAVTVVRNGTLGRICKSAPTVFINYMAQAVTFVQWQYFFNSPTCPPETRCVCTNKVLHHPIYGNQNQMAQAVTVVRNGTLGRIYKSAPTIFINYMAQAVTFVQWQYFFNSPMWDCWRSISCTVGEG